MNMPIIGNNAQLHAQMKMAYHQWWKPFIKQTHHPHEIQQALLERILSVQADTAFGNKYRFGRLRGYHEFRFGGAHS